MITVIIFDPAQVENNDPFFCDDCDKPMQTEGLCPECSFARYGNVQPAKYLVISFDDSNEQTYYDYLMAYDEDHACSKVEEARGYAVVVAAWAEAELMNASAYLAKMSISDIEERWDRNKGL